MWSPVRESNSVWDLGFRAMDSGLWIPRHGFRILDSRYWIQASLSVELAFWIPIISGILDSLSCIPDSKAEAKFHVFLIPQGRIFRIPESRFSNMG